MSKKVLELSLSFFLIVCALGILFAANSINTALESYLSIIEEQRATQEEVLKSARSAKEVLYEVGIAVSVLSLNDEGVLQTSEANKMLEESVETISKHSERLGKLARHINEFRINPQAKR